MPRYRVKGIRKDTLRPSSYKYWAFDEEVASDLADEEGMYVEEVELIPATPATERQIDYAEILGIDLPDDCDVDEASSLITNAVEEDTVASNKLLEIASGYKLYTTRFSGEKDIYERLLPWLSTPGRERELTEWFVFNLYRDKIKNRNDIELEGPDDHKVWSIASKLYHDERVLKSIRRYEGIDLIRFQSECSDGSYIHGGSRNTIAYKAANKLIKESIDFWAKPSIAKPSSTSESSPVDHSEEELPPLPYLLLELAIKIPISGFFFWILYKLYF